MLLCSTLCLLVTGCLGRSEQEIQAEFDAFVAQHDQCSNDEECVLVSAGCPLGCVAAVNVESAPLVERKARELIDEYRGNGRRCEYDCVQVQAGCVEAHCRKVAE